MPMRRSAVVLFALVAACSSAQESVPTTIVQSTTTSIEPPTTAASIEVTTTTDASALLTSLVYEEIARMSFPVQMTAHPGSSLSYIATKDGHVWVYDGDTVGDLPVLDIAERVLDGGERGLLSIALHPTDMDRMFLHYTAHNNDTVVSEFSFIDDFTADPESERVLLRLDQPAANHNGGMIQFGHDGTLYVGLGDGGGAGDRFDNAQNLNTLLGGLVTLQVDGDPDPTLFAHGLRNPWRFWIDGEVIYIADVGQGSFEEVSVTGLVSDINFGWPITEGLHCFRPASGCDTSGLTLPVIEVSHSDSGTCSITGGVVYRGEAIPELAGTYFYSDFCGGYLRSFRHEEGGIVDEKDWTDQVGVPGRVIGFGVDGEGEIYVGTTDSLMRLAAVRG
jgi:glucose/arabinose dehydrogenase